MQSTKDSCASTVRGVLESTHTAFRIAVYPPRAVVFRQGDPCDSVMHVEQGCVRLTVTARSGREGICGLVGRGAFLGEEALGGEPVRRQTAFAMTASEILIVEKGAMCRLLHAQHGLADRLIAHVLARENQLETELTN